MTDLVTSGYTVDDLHRLRNELNLAAHLELDPWGSLIVSPADDEHETAMAVLVEQAIRQLDLPPGSVRPTERRGPSPAAPGTS